FLLLRRRDSNAHLRVPKTLGLPLPHSALSYSTISQSSASTTSHCDSVAARFGTPGSLLFITTIFAQPGAGCSISAHGSNRPKTAWFFQIPRWTFFPSFIARRASLKSILSQPLSTVTTSSRLENNPVHSPQAIGAGNPPLMLSQFFSFRRSSFCSHIPPPEPDNRIELMSSPYKGVAATTELIRHALKREQAVPRPAFSFTDTSSLWHSRASRASHSFPFPYVRLTGFEPAQPLRTTSTSS